MKKRKLICIAAAIFMLLSTLSFSAAEGLPSVIVNEEEWFKDSLSPLISKDGKYFLPVEALAMLDGVIISTPQEDSILVMNSVNGRYISILFMLRAAAVNGEVIEDIDVFRDEGVYYADAELITDALGVSLEYYTSENGEVSARISDENRILTLEELIENYENNGNSEDSVGSLDFGGSNGSDSEDSSFDEDSDARWIYVVCETPEYDGIMFPARGNLDYYGVGYTYFMNENVTDELIKKTVVMGDYGFAIPEIGFYETNEETADAIVTVLDKCNERVRKFSGRISRLTISTGHEELDSLLEVRGYYPIRADFYVNGSSYPAGVLDEIMAYLEAEKSCTVYLDDCWSSEQMAVLFSELTVEDSRYRVLNLGKR